MNANVGAPTADINALLANYSLPTPLGFGVELAPIMFRADYRDGEWSAGQLEPFAPIAINPAATCVQFGQQCFEGMKAYQIAQSEPYLFRPESNYARFQRSAARLSMPAPTPELFGKAISQLCGAFQSFVPGDSGQSLYLRPTLLGLDHTFAVKASDNYCFLLLASPSDAYYGKPISIMIEREHSRAAMGGTGAEKVGGNYAGSLLATRKSIDAGFDQPLWLDAASHSAIEELSGMNFMAVIDGALHTPSLSGTILPGVTRSSLLKLAASMGLKTVERSMLIADLMADVKSGACSELFACGTAAIISPISAIGEADGNRLSLPKENPVTTKLKTALLDIQEGRAEDAFGWTAKASDQQGLINRLKV